MWGDEGGISGARGLWSFASPWAQEKRGLTLPHREGRGEAAADHSAEYKSSHGRTFSQTNTVISLLQNRLGLFATEPSWPRLQRASNFTG